MFCYFSEYIYTLNFRITLGTWGALLGNSDFMNKIKAKDAILILRLMSVVMKAIIAKYYIFDQGGKFVRCEGFSFHLL